MIKIKTTSPEVGFLKLLEYGYPGVGKTMFASTAPKPIFLDMEGGLMSVSDKKVKYVKIRTQENLDNAIEYLRNEKHSFETVVIDSLTEMQRVLMRSIVKNNPRIKRPFGDSSSQTDWGRLIEIMGRYVRMFRDLNMHLIMTCLPTEPKNWTFITSDADGNLDSIESEELGIKLVPALSGRYLPQEICGMVDIVGYLYTKRKKDRIIRKMLFEPYGFFAKDRSGKLPESLSGENLSFTKMIEIVKNG